MRSHVARLPRRWCLWPVHREHAARALHAGGAEHDGEGDTAVLCQAHVLVRKELYDCRRNLRRHRVRHRVGTPLFTGADPPLHLAHAAVQYRAKHDIYNSALAGCLTGGALAYKSTHAHPHPL